LLILLTIMRTPVMVSHINKHPWWSAVLTNNRDGQQYQQTTWWSAISTNNHDG
jgi:hypothetical protein